MNSDFAIALTTDMLWTAALIAGPILLLTTVVGLAVSILQVITQIQEMSLTFVPKLIAVAIAIVVAGPWMLRSLIRFATATIANIPAVL